MTTEKHDPWTLLREAREAFVAIETVADDSYDCDCPPEWLRCGACRIKQHSRSAQRRIDAALAEHDAVPSSKNSDEIRAIWRAYANRELSEDEAKAKLAARQGE